MEPTVYDGSAHSAASNEPPATPREFRLSDLFQLRWLFPLVLAFAAFTRFYAVAAKPLHHDESLFAYYSYFLYRGSGYDYQPILHGPVLEHFTALVFLIFGDNHLTMRLPAILGGLVLFLVVWYWRRYLGRVGTAAAFVLLALSPTITYYSRFLRNDVPYMTVTVWCALCALRAFQTGQRRYFWGGILAATIAFSMMESSIFFFVSCVSFLVVVTLTDWLSGWGTPASAPRRFPGRALFFAPRLRESGEVGLNAGVVMRSLPAAAALAIILAWFYHRIFADSLHLLADRTSHPAVVIGFLLLPLAYVFCLVIGANWRRPYGKRGLLHYVLHVMAANSWVILAALLLSVALYELLFTTYFTHTSGPDFYGNERAWTPVQIYKNTWDYWWDQHKLHRIKGPFHYYLPILFLYELPAILVVFWGWWRSLRSRPARWVHLGVLFGTQLVALVAYLTVSAIARKYYGLVLDWDLIDKKFHLTGPGHFFLILFYIQMLTYVTGVLYVRGWVVEAFLTTWMVGGLFAYSYAGEKVPWLVVHVAGPLCLLAGLYIQRLWQEVNWTRFGRVAATTAIFLAVLWQARNLTYANFVHPASPVERIVYNHTSPDIDYAVSRIADIGHKTNYGKQVPVLVQGEMEWPLYWYLREYSNIYYVPATAPLETAETTSRPVVLVNWDSSNVNNLKQNYNMERLKVREWWEPSLLNVGALFNIYRALTPQESRRSSENGYDFQTALFEWKKLWHYLAYRQIWLDPDDPGYSNGANEFALCVRKDLAQQYLERDWLGLMPPRRDVPVYP